MLPSLVKGMYNTAEHPDPASRYLIAMWRCIPGPAMTTNSETQENEEVLVMAKSATQPQEEHEERLIRIFERMVKMCKDHGSDVDLRKREIKYYPWQQTYDRLEGHMWAVQFAKAALELPHFLDDKEGNLEERKARVMARVKEDIRGRDDWLEQAFKEAEGEAL